MTKYDVYVAGPFFNPVHIAEMEAIEDILASANYKMFRPRFDSVDLGKDSSPLARKQAFNDDVEAIEQSAFMLANTRDKDMGTVFEVGYAYKAGVPVIGFAGGLPEGAPFNIMLAGSMVKVFTSLADLDSFINSFDSPQQLIESLETDKFKEYEGIVE